MHEFLFFFFLHYMATDSAEEMGLLPGQLPTSVHMGTCWLSEGASPTHVQQVPRCPLSQKICPSFLDCGK